MASFKYKCPWWFKKFNTKHKANSNTTQSKDSTNIPEGRHVASPFVFHSVGEDWQRKICTDLHLTFEKPNGVSRRGHDVPLGPPELSTLKSIVGDGNCMFRALSYLVTGSEEQHGAVRNRIVQHMKDTGNLMLQAIISSQIADASHTGRVTRSRGAPIVTSVDQYLRNTKMQDDCVWGTGIELLCFAHLTKTCVLSYLGTNRVWDKLGPHNVDRSYAVDNTDQSLYLLNQNHHYEVVMSTREEQHPIVDSNCTIDLTSN